MPWKTLLVAMAMIPAALPTIAAKVAPAEPLDEHLENFRPFLGTTWRGVFANSTPEKPVVDVMTYERALNGEAVRTFHSINDGDYGGETLIYWDADRKTLAFFYLTTAGFRTEGTLTSEKNKYASLETVKGEANGITQVRGVAELLPTGRILVMADYFKEGKWHPARKTEYVRDDTARVKFR